MSHIIFHDLTPKENRFSNPRISRTRVVLFATANLYRLRDWAYMLPINLNQEIADLQEDGDLTTMYEKYKQNSIEEGVSLHNKVLQKFGVDGASITFEGFVSVIKDCQKDLIPFWEIDIAEGTISQITSTKSYLVIANDNLKIFKRMEQLIQTLELERPESVIGIKTAAYRQSCLHLIYMKKRLQIPFIGLKSLAFRFPRCSNRSFY